MAFIIRDPDSRPVAAKGSRLFETSILEAELCATWTGIVYTRLNLWTDKLAIEGSSSTVIG